MDFFHHILVPVDFTEKNQSALQVALRLAQDHRARLTLLHVIETIQYASSDELSEFYAMLEDKAREKMRGMAEPFVASGLEVIQEIIYGNRGEEMVRVSIDSGADLIVLSSHKVDLDQPAKGWGTLSYQVSILCQCPVLLVK